MMIAISYALIRQDSDGTYELFGLGRCHVDSKKKIQDLYHHAAQRICQNMGLDDLEQV